MNDSRDMEGSVVHAWAAARSGEENVSSGKAAFTIGELSREFGVTLRALRFYENKGLISPQRDGLNRLYSQGDRTRLGRHAQRRRTVRGRRGREPLLASDGPRTEASPGEHLPCVPA